MSPDTADWWDPPWCALCQKQGYKNLLLRTHGELDLTDQLAVRRFFEAERPEAVIMAAARVGGISCE